MKRHSIVVRLNSADTKQVHIEDKASLVSELRFVDGNRRIGHGIGQMLDELTDHGMHPGETAIDLAILAATVTAADTMISRADHAQDSWTREVDLYLPVSEPNRWNATAKLIERTLQFLTGDMWRVVFRPRQKGMKTLIDRAEDVEEPAFDSVCLFSGGLDSFVGAIDLLATEHKPILVSHYRDASTKNQPDCADALGKEYGNMLVRHVRANVSFDKNDMPGLSSETTTRGRSFIFFALACLAADALPGETPIHVPENGLISLNVPLNPLRIGAWSTRTTHPFYMARWQELVDSLEIKGNFANPYRFMTKGEMLAACKNRNLLKKHIDTTVSCSSLTKGRWKGLPPGHCGYCTPCLIRRASVEAAFETDPTNYSIPDLTDCVLDLRQAESRDVRAFQMMSRRLSRNPELARILIRKPGPLTDYDAQEISHYADVFRRGIAEVGRIVDDVEIEAA